MSKLNKKLYIYIGESYEVRSLYHIVIVETEFVKGHLDRLIPHLEEFLGKQGIDFTCYVGHQIDMKSFTEVELKI